MDHPKGEESRTATAEGMLSSSASVSYAATQISSAPQTLDASQLLDRAN